MTLELSSAGGSGGGPHPSAVRVWNNGRAFTDADWQRVRKIAAGNPDEASVGLFGVGFFSVFALTDAPEIHSGGARLRFTWAEDSELVADESPLAVPQPGAAFVLPLKPASDALEWGHGEELARLRGMLASMLLFSKSLATLTLRTQRSAHGATVGKIATALVDLEESTPWTAVKPSWSVKQRWWVEKVSAVSEADEDEAVASLKSLAHTFQSSLKHKALAEWFAPAAATWVARCAEATSASGLAPVVEGETERQA